MFDSNASQGRVLCSHQPARHWLAVRFPGHMAPWTTMPQALHHRRHSMFVSILLASEQSCCCCDAKLSIRAVAMSQVTVLLDWSNYVFAKMEPVIESFLASSLADRARDLLIELHEQQHDLDTVRRFQTKLRKLLRTHAKEYRRSVSQELVRPQCLLQDSRLGPEAHIYYQTQPTDIHLVVVTEQGKKGRWKTQQLVVHKAKQLAEQCGVSLGEFEGTEALAEGAAEHSLPAVELDAEQQEERLLQELKYRLRGALIFTARDELEKALPLAKPLQIQGTTADETIAAVVHENALNDTPVLICIKSDDTDFWQLKSYGLSQVGIKCEVQLTAAGMPENYLRKEALLGKGQADLNTFGTAFGPVPHEVECIDAAGTSVVGSYRPGDAVYAEQFAAFDAAVRQQEPWQWEMPELLQWLQQFQHQVQSIRARFLIKMVEHNINPYSEWSAMPEDVQQRCSEAAKQVVGKAAAAAAAVAAVTAAYKVPTFADVQLAALSEWLPPSSTPSKSGTSSNSNSTKKKQGNKKKGRK